MVRICKKQYGKEIKIPLFYLPLLGGIKGGSNLQWSFL